jgi:ketosteroid isomerase-like protein
MARHCIARVSKSDAEVVRRWLDAAVGWFASPREFAQLAQINDQYMTHDVTYEEDPVWPDAGTYQGRDAVSRRFLEYRDLMHIERIARGRVIDAGDSVLAEVRIEMLGADAAAPVEFLWTYTVRVEDGRIAQFRAWYDPTMAARAAGLTD